MSYSTFKAIIGNKIAPWYADKVLADTGFEGQQTAKDVSNNRQNNVWEPVPEDRGAYGDFADIATDKSFTLWASINRNIVRAVAGLGAVALVLGLKARKD